MKSQNNSHVSAINNLSGVVRKKYEALLKYFILQMMNDAEKEDEKKEEAEKDAVMQELHNLDNVSDGDDVSK